MAQYLNDSIFWIEVEKIQPNPYQPRREFNQEALRDLADSIRQYGVLQPLVVTRKEEPKENGDGLRVSYELIAGERRLRASKLAEISQVPAVIRAAEEDPKAKLEIAIIENLQREDLNPIDRAYAFGRLVEEFGFKHSEVAKKVGRSREYISNTLRLLELPEEIMQAVRDGKISEGHARTMMMLSDRPDEQKVLFKEIVYKKLSVREAEGIAREIAHDKVRKKKHKPDPELSALEGKLSNTLGTRVHIERKENGGKLVIDFFSNNDLEDILAIMESNQKRGANAFMDRFIEAQEQLKQKQVESQEGGVVSSQEVSDVSNNTPAPEEVSPDTSAEGAYPASEKVLEDTPQKDHESFVEHREEVAEPVHDMHENLENAESVSDDQRQTPQENYTPEEVQPRPDESFSHAAPLEPSQENSALQEKEEEPIQEPSLDDAFVQQEEQKKSENEDGDLYSVKNFTI